LSVVIAGLELLLFCPVKLCVVMAIAPATTATMPAAIKTTSKPFCIVLLGRFCLFFYLIMLHGSPVGLAIPRPTSLGDPHPSGVLVLSYVVSGLLLQCQQRPGPLPLMVAALP